MELTKSTEFYELEERLLKISRSGELLSAEELQANKKGFFSPRYGLYALHTLGLSILLAVNVVVLIAGGGFWIQMANAVLLAFVFGQGGLNLMHAIAHGQVSGSRWRQVMYHIIDLLLGWCTKGWERKHDWHHAFPNTLGKDPDTELAFIALTPAQAQAKTGLCKLTTRYQHILIPFLLLFMIWHLRYASVRRLLAEDVQRARVSMCLIGIHMVVYLGALFYFLPPWHAVGVFAIHNGLLGLYLGMAFVVNHTGMPILEPSAESDYLWQQATTARNISGGWWVTFLLGGLNFQIEHHLWSGMPHYNLRKVAEVVQPFCEQRGIPYHVVSPRKACVEVYVRLREIAQYAK